MRKHLATTLLALAIGAQSTYAQSVDRTIDRAVAAWQAAKTVRASFEQTLTNPLTGSDVTARGDFQQEGRNRIDIRFTDPAGDRIVADGKWVWFYLPSSTPGQVVRTRIAPGSQGSPDLTAQFLDTPKSRFDVTDLGRDAVNGRPARVLSLVPKQGVDVPFTKAVIWVDSTDALIRQFELTEPSEIVRRVTIRTLTLNPTVSASAFRFTPPSGTKVIEQ